jgi:acyl-CoA synthetase (NDP forming)
MNPTMTKSDLDLLFAPRSIAVVGASNKTGKMGYLFMQRLTAEFRGTLYAVNPNEREVGGVMTVKSITEVSDAIDLLIALVPAARLIELVESCRPGQVRYLLAIPSGFGEISEQGRALQERLASAARARGMRTLGPNIVGVMNAVAGINASMMPALPPGGRGLSCVTQSGGFGMALSMYALDHDLKVAKFCDLGNMVDLQVHEVLQYLAEDPNTEVVGLFLEAGGHRSAFQPAVEEVVARKPMIVTLAGVTAVGRRTSLAHIGIADRVVELEDTLPAGVIRAETALELLNASKALLWQPRASGRRVAIATGTGGIGVELADLAARHGFDVPEFSASLQKRLRGHLPYFAGVHNPVDFTPIWWDYPTIYPHILDEIARSGETDLVIVSVTDVATTRPELAQSLATWTKSGDAMPTIVYWGARDCDRENMRTLEAARIPCYRSTREAVRAAGALLGGCREQDFRLARTPRS